MTTTEAAKLLDVPAKTIASWKGNRRVFPVGLIPGRGRGGKVPIYLLDELRPLAEAYHQRHTRRSS